MSKIEEQQYIRMTQTPVGRLILTLGIPTTISMLITNIYNMADTYFVSQISMSASGATGIVFAVMAILQAFGFMLGHGAGSNISRQLGARKVERAKIFASTSFYMSVGIGIVILGIGLFFLEPLMYLLGSTDTILQDAKDYAFYIFIASPAMTAGCVLNNILRYEGKATFAMFGLTAGGILNMILDPIFIFYFHMDIQGAGLSTAISQYIGTAILFLPFVMNKTVTKMHPKYITRNLSDVRNILITGSPSFFRQGLGSISTSVLNIMAKPFGDAAIAAMSIIGRVGNLLFSFALGIAQGYQPVVSFNYGSKRYDRVKKGTWFTMTAGTVILGGLCIICFIHAETIIQWFRNEESIVMIGSRALRILCLTLFTQPISSVGNMMFQSIGKSKPAVLLALLQSGLIFIPLVLILPNIGLGILGIQLAQPLAYLISCLITVPFVYFFLKNLDIER